MAAGYVPTSPLNTLYSNTTAGTAASPDAVDGAIQAIVTAVNENYDSSQGINTSLSTHKNAAVLDHPDQSVTTAKIKDVNVTTAKIADVSVTTAKLADLSVTRAKIAAGAVGSSQLDPALLTNYGEIAVQAKFTEVDAEVTSLSNKRKRKIRKERTFKFTKVTFPVGFGWQDAPINILFDGINYTTDFDVSVFKNISTNTYWVDPITGLNTNAGTEGAPFLTIEKAYTVAVAGDTIQLKAGTYFRDTSWKAIAAIQKSINVIAAVPGTVKLPFADNLTYTLTSGNVYQANRSSVEAVVDFSFHEWGFKYTQVASIALCQSTIGSWYTDGTILYVHALNGKIPNSLKIHALLTGSHFKAVNDLAAVNFYLEELTIIGGSFGNIWCDRLSAVNQMNIYGKNCKFLYTTGNGANADSVNVDGVDNAFFQGCVAAFANKDGFNYASYNSASVEVHQPRFIEVNCIGANNGLSNSVVGSENTNNGSTAHSGAKGIRVNCTYFGNMGSNLADVQTGTQSLNFAPTAYDPKSGTGDIYDTNICTQQAGAEMWVYGAVTFGAAWDVYAISGSTLHLYDSEFDSKQGGGTIEIVNPI